MLKFVTIVVAALSAVALGSAAYAQSTPHHQLKHSKTAPADAQDPADPTDVTSVPKNVQKWIGGAVDDILTGADKAIDPAVDGKR